MQNPLPLTVTQRCAFMRLLPSPKLVKSCIEQLLNPCRDDCGVLRRRGPAPLPCRPRPRRRSTPQSSRHGLTGCKMRDLTSFGEGSKRMNAQRCVTVNGKGFCIEKHLTYLLSCAFPMAAINHPLSFIISIENSCRKLISTKINLSSK